MSKIFEVKFDRLAVMLLPYSLRKDKLVAFAQVLFAPVKALHRDFISHRTRVLYDLDHDGRVCRLRKLLNDKFDPDLRRIRLSDGQLFEQQYIYTHAEEQSRFLGTMYLRQSSDFADAGVDFRVIVPQGFDLASVEIQMKATINYYKLAAKRYKIQIDE